MACPKGASAWLLLCACLALMLTAGCATRRPAPQPAPPPPPSAAAALDPLLAQPLSWSKLDQLEAWLRGPGQSAPPAARAEARLALAEGLATYLRLDAQRLGPATLAARRERATELYREVLGDHQAPTLARARARGGLERMGAQPAAAPPAVAAGPVLPRARWGAQAAIPARMTPARTGWSRITVHHTAMDARHLLSASPDSAAADLRQIQHNHMHGQGWGDIGYHFLIDPSGRIYEGRTLAWQGAHAGNSANNERNIGVCLLGDFSRDRPTPAALAALQGLLDNLSAQHRIPRHQVFGHQDFRNTACPGEHLMAWVNAYKRGGLAPANSSRIASVSHVHDHPSDCSACGSPTISSGSSGLARDGSRAVD